MKNRLAIVLVTGSLLLAACSADVDEGSVGQTEEAATAGMVDVFCGMGRGYSSGTINKVPYGGPDFNAFCADCRASGGSCAWRNSMYGIKGSDGCPPGKVKTACGCIPQGAICDGAPRSAQ